MSQIPLDLSHAPSFEMADFVVSSSNEAAFELLQSWPGWPGHVAALAGPKASGKTHLAMAWADEVGATVFTLDGDVSQLKAGQPVVVEDLDRDDLDEASLFHLFNWTKEIGSTLLLTGQTAPNRWEIELPDLRSRLATVAVGEILQPDDDLLLVLMVKLFSDRQLQVDMTVLNYALARIERSFNAIYHFVSAVDQAALASKKRVTKALAKTCLETG